MPDWNNHVPASGRPPEKDEMSTFKGMVGMLSFRDQPPDKRQKLKQILKYGLMVIMLTALITTAAIGYWPNETESKTLKDIRHQDKVKSILQSGCQWESGNKQLTCLRISFPENVSTVLQELTKAKNLGADTATLVLSDCIFVMNTVTPGWLPLNSTQPSVTELTLDGSSIENLSDNSLTDFSELDSLRILSTSISYLTKNAIQGPKKLTQLSMVNNENLHQVESALLQGSRISTLQLQGFRFSNLEISNQFFRNLTGERIIPTVATLDLQYNILQTLTPAVIEGYNNIKSLYLTGNIIEDIETNTFHTALTLEQIFLDSNVIREVPEETFGALVRKGTVIYLKNNRLNCTCNMVWLQNYILQVDSEKKQYEAFLNVTCTTPDILFNVPFLDALMCPDEITTTTRTTIPDEPLQTTEIPTDDPLPSTEKPGEDLKCDDLTQFTIQVSNVVPKFTIRESSHADIQVTLQQIYPNPLLLIWYCVHCKEPQCRSIDHHGIHITDLLSETDYVFCLYDNVTKTEGECQAHQTLPEPQREPWLLEADKVGSLTGVVGGLLAMFALGGGISFCIIRNKPTLLRGSGRVEVVKARSGDVVLVMPDKFSKTGTSSSDISHSGIQNEYDTISGYVSVGDTQSPPPLPPYPPGWRNRPREKGEEHVYLEPQRMPRRPPKNLDLLVEYEWHTLQQLRRTSAETIGSDVSSVDGPY